MAEFWSDPEFVEAYLQASWEEGDREGVLRALRWFVQRRGWQTIAEACQIKRAALVQMLSVRGNPPWPLLLKIMQSLGFQLSLQRLPLA